MGTDIDAIDIVDDDPAIREALSSLPRASGKNVRLFTSGADFLSFEREDTPACLRSGRVHLTRETARQTNIQARRSCAQRMHIGHSVQSFLNCIGIRRKVVLHLPASRFGPIQA
jgi:hypothetical protein